MRDEKVRFVFQMWTARAIGPRAHSHESNSVELRGLREETKMNDEATKVFEMAAEIWREKYLRAQVEVIKANNEIRRLKVILENFMTAVENADDDENESGVELAWLEVLKETRPGEEW